MWRKSSDGLVLHAHRALPHPAISDRSPAAPAASTSSSAIAAASPAAAYLLQHHSTMAGLEGAFLCLGNPLLDISSKVDAAFLDKYEVRPLALKGNGR